MSVKKIKKKKNNKRKKDKRKSKKEKRKRKKKEKTSKRHKKKRKNRNKDKKKTIHSFSFQGLYGIFYYTKEDLIWPDQWLQNKLNEGNKKSPGPMYFSLFLRLAFVFCSFLFVLLFFGFFLFLLFLSSFLLLLFSFNKRKCNLLVSKRRPYLT